MANESKITAELAADEPITLDANFQDDANYKRYVDNQIIGTQEHVVESVISGSSGTWPKLSASSAAGVTGDWVVLTGIVDNVPVVTKLTSGTLIAAGSPYGILSAGGTPGSRVHVIRGGAVSNTITGLSTSSNGKAIVNSSARTVVTTPSGSDYIVGDVVGGQLTILHLLPGGSGTYSGDATSLRGFGITLDEPTINQVLTYDGEFWTPEDVNSNATKLQGYDIYPTAPLETQQLVYSPPNGWEPKYVYNVINVLNFGVIADADYTNPGTGTNQDIAIEAAIASIGPYRTDTAHGAILYFPPSVNGKAYKIKNVRVEMSLDIMGSGGASPQGGTKFLVEDGGSGFIFLDNNCSPHGGSSSGSVIRNCFFYSFRKPNCEFWSPNTAYSIGNTFKLIQDGRFYYECIKAGTTGNGSSGREINYNLTNSPDLSEPWRKGSLGGTAAYGWTVRSSDTSHSDVFFMSEGPFFGYTINGEVEPTWNYTVGSLTTESGLDPDTLGPVTINWRCYSSVGKILNDGTGYFACKLSSAIFLKSNVRIENVQVQGTGATAIPHNGCGIAVIADLTPPQGSSASSFSISNLKCASTRVGVYIAGGDANAGGVAYAQLFGTDELIPAGYPSGQLPVGYPAPGQPNPSNVAFWDRSFLGNHHLAVHTEGWSGRSHVFDNSASTGTMVGLYQEAGQGKILVTGGWRLFGGTIGSGIDYQGVSTSAIGSGASGGLNNAFERDETLTPNAIAKLVQSSTTSGVWAFRSLDDSYTTIRQYGNIASGWWSDTSATSGGDYASWGWSGSQATEGPGQAWAINGFWEGRNSGTFRPSHYRFASYHGWTNSQIRGGDRKIGDTKRLAADAVVGQFAERIVTTDGVEGRPWVPATTYLSGSAIPNPDAYKAATIRPTDTYIASNPTAETLRYRAIIGGVSHTTTEPDWLVVAPNLNDEYTESGSALKWRNVGNSPIMSPYGVVEDSNFAPTPQTTIRWKDYIGTGSATAAKTNVDSRRRQGQTTTGAANQILDNGGTFGGVDFTLADNAVTVVSVELKGKANGAAGGVAGTIMGKFYRDASGNCVRIGTDVNSIEAAGTIAGTTAALVINGTKVELQVSPGAAVTIDWGWVRQQGDRIS